MSFPNVSDILATTIESRSGTIADNVTQNTALLARLKQRGKIKPFSGGHKIYQELSFAQNGNAGWYSGYEDLPLGASDVITAAEYNIKQAAVPVVISGLEMLQNAGKEQIIDLLESRLAVAEATLTNLISDGLYSDGTGSGGKEIDGLDAAVPDDPTTGTYGNISRVTWTFWRSQLVDPGSTPTASTIQASLNDLWVKCVRNSDRPDLIVMDNVLWAMYLASLQTLQRFTDTTTAGIGFPSIKYMDADVVLDGGIGGDATASRAYFLNTKYLHFRPHKDRNMVPLSPTKRYAANQDAEVQILAWAGNLTCSGAQFQGRLIGT
jgi:hypothetical protein